MDIVTLRRTNLRNLIDETILSKKVLTDAAFCELYDLNPSHISQLVKGHGSFGERAARKLEKKIGLASGYFDQNHEGQTQSQDGESQHQVQHMNFIPPIDIDENPPSRQTPVISWVQAGDYTAVLASDLSNVIEWIPYSPRAGKYGFALIVKGISMEPEFKPDEYIYINPTYQMDELNTGALVVMACNGDTEATFKELVAEDGNYYLRPLNPNWQPKIIPIDHTCSLVGKVVGKYKHY